MKKLLTQRTAAAFDSWAGHYEDDAEMMVERRGYSYRALGIEIRGLLQLRDGDRILEVGTGPGKLGIEVRSSSFGISLIGVDISARMVDLASSRCVYDFIGRASFERLPFENQAFDGVFSSFVVHSVLDQKRAFHELRRVVRPGARVVLVDLCPVGRSLLASIVLGCVHALRYEGAPARYVPVQEYIRIALEAGFEIEKVKPLGARKRYSHFLLALRR